MVSCLIKVLSILLSLILTAQLLASYFVSKCIGFIAIIITTFSNNLQKRPSFFLLVDYKKQLDTSEKHPLL
jgi:hypothetical protein